MNATQTPAIVSQPQPAITILGAAYDRKLFAPWFKRGDWSRWFTFLSVLFGLPLNRKERRIFEACTRRTILPATAFNEAWLVVGRRGGKSFIVSLIAVYLACFYDYRPFLQPGERGVIQIIAADRRQARVILRYIRALITQVPMLAALIERDTADGIDLNNSISITVHTASFRTVRGATIVAALCDEIAFWRNEESANPDWEIVNAVRPGMATIPNAMLIGLSSPYAKRGVLYDAHRRYFGKNDAPILVWQADTRTMNPTVPQRVIDEATERDPSSAAAEYGAQFRSDIEAFVSIEQVENCTREGPIEIPYSETHRYNGFVDPSGGSADSMTLAIGHVEKDLTAARYVVDVLRERKPPFSPESVVSEFADLLCDYRISAVVGDRYAGEWPRERFAVHRIRYEPSAKPKSDLYRDVLPLINGVRLELPPVIRLKTQLCSLERRTSRGGRDSIDHPPGSHDDLANAVAGAAAVVTAHSRKHMGTW
jgi:hypothetical protein